MDNKLNFNHHINNVCKKASQRIGVLMRLKNLIPTEAKLQLYKAAILPHLTRGGEWYLEKRGSRKILADLEISEAFLISLEVSFLHGLFLLFLSLEIFYQRVSGSDF